MVSLIVKLAGIIYKAEKPGGKGNGMHPLWQFPQIESSDGIRY
jgi:hypothetical protein